MYLKQANYYFLFFPIKQQLDYKNLTSENNGLIAIAHFFVFSEGIFYTLSVISIAHFLDSYSGSISGY